MFDIVTNVLSKNIANIPPGIDEIWVFQHTTNTEVDNTSVDDMKGCGGGLEDTVFVGGASYVGMEPRVDPFMDKQWHKLQRMENRLKSSASLLVENTMRR